MTTSYTMADFFKARRRAANSVGRMIPTDVRALLDGANIAHVATLLRDGAPHSVPVWVALEGERVAFLSSANSVKGRNLRRDPRVAISITDAGTPNSMAQVRGRLGEIVDGDRGWEIIDAIAHKYIGAPYPLRTDRVAFLIDVEHAWSFAP
jgi:PPOX class probable F420-dependent enzyme